MLTLIKTRRAIRHYTDQPVELWQIEAVLQSAVWAPSAHNRQPWRFAVVTNPADKAQLAQVMGSRLEADRTADGDAPLVIARDVQRSHQRIVTAPVVIVVCLSMQDMDIYPDIRRAHAEWVMAVQSVAMAAQTMWLAAHSLGLGMGWLCAPLFTPEVVAETLQLPADWKPQGLMTMGYPAEQPVKTRHALDLKVRWI